MRRFLLGVIACPICQGDLLSSEPQFNSGEAGDLENGELSCQQGHHFPIINGIPRLLKQGLLAETLKRFHPEYVNASAERPADPDEDESTLKLKTLRNFGYQWTTFSEMYEHWGDNFRSYFEPLMKPSDFRGKFVLDAGCGFGRHSFHAAANGAKVIAMDLSEAVEAARHNTRECENVDVIQGDIFDPPLKPVFDLVYSVGVIQHLPDPEGGFLSLSRLLKKDGGIFVWVYGKRKGLYRLVDLMRLVFRSTSMRSLYYISLCLNVLSFLVFSLPFKVLRSLPWGRGISARLPFTRYADLPFRVGHADWFDRLAAPSTEYFERQEVETWFANARVADFELQSRDGIGWRALGRLRNTSNALPVDP